MILLSLLLYSTTMSRRYGAGIAGLNAQNDTKCKQLALTGQLAPKLAPVERAFLRGVC